MRPDRSSTPTLAQGPCARQQLAPSTTISHTFSYVARRCLPRSLRGAGYLPGSHEYPDRSQHQNR